MMKISRALFALLLVPAYAWGAPPPNHAALATGAVNISTATTTEVFPAAKGKQIDVTSFMLSAAGADTAVFKYGTKTSTPCDTGAVSITGPLQFGANTIISIGDGSSPVFTVPVGNELCITTTGAVVLAGHVSAEQYSSN